MGSRRVALSTSAEGVFSIETIPSGELRNFSRTHGWLQICFSMWRAKSDRLALFRPGPDRLTEEQGRGVRGEMVRVQGARGEGYEVRCQGHYVRRRGLGPGVSQNKLERLGETKAQNR